MLGFFNVTMIISVVLAVFCATSSVVQGVKDRSDWFSLNDGDVQFGWRGVCANSCADYSDGNDDDSEDLEIRGIVAIICSSLHGVAAAGIIGSIVMCKFNGNLAGTPVVATSAGGLIVASISIGVLGAKVRELADDSNQEVRLETAAIMGTLSCIFYAAMVVLGVVAKKTKF